MSAPSTVIPAGTLVDGRIEAPRDLRIEGRCEGQVEVGGVLTVAEGAVCRASIRARDARIYGDVIGNILCSGAVAVAAGARVVGDIRAPEVSIHAAAEVDGTVNLLPPEPAEQPVVRTRGRVRGATIERPSPPPRPRDEQP